MRFLLHLVTLAICVQAQQPAVPPAVEPGALREKLISVICPGKYTATTCTPCPEETGFAGQGTMTIGPFWRGHFRNRSKEDVIVSVGGCHGGDSLYGGSYLIEVGSGEAIWYERAIITNQCERFEFDDGRDGLVCTRGRSHLGETWEQLYEIRAEDDSPILNTVFTISDSDASGCFSDRGIADVSRGRIKSWKIIGRTLQITVMHGSGFLNQAQCKQLSTHPGQGILDRLVPVAEYRLEFQFDGRHFKPSEANPPWSLSNP